jgi:hypothetical protein
MITKKHQGKRPRGRPATGETTLIGLRLQWELEQALERWMRKQKVLSLTKQEAIRRLMRKALTEAGELKAEKPRDADD